MKCMDALMNVFEMIRDMTRPFYSRISAEAYRVDQRELS